MGALQINRHLSRFVVVLLALSTILAQSPPTSVTLDASTDEGGEPSVGPTVDGSGQEEAEPGGGGPNRVSSISKCCGMNETYNSEGQCQTDLTPFTPSFMGEEPQIVDIIQGLTCQYGSYRLNPDEDKGDEFHLLPNGSLFLPKMEVVTRLVLPGSYCVENITSPDGSWTILALLCFPPPQEEQDWKRAAMRLYSFGCLVSVPFLGTTTVLFFFVPKLSDLRGRVLGTYTGCLMMAFISLFCVQTFGSNLPHTPCVLTAFFIQFSFLASFFWLNVLCFHTWWKVRLSEELSATTVRMEKKRYLHYSLYAWIFPAIVLIISIVLNFQPSIPHTAFKPNFGVNSCWFDSNEAAATLFYGPIGLLLVANLLFFILTGWVLWRNDIRSGMTSGEMSRLAWLNIRKIRQKTFQECLALFCVMGLNWMMELISWGVGGPIVLWLLTDIINTLQGPIIFYLFVWRVPNTRKHAKRLCLECNWRCHKVPRTPPIPGSIAAGLPPPAKELKPLRVTEGPTASSFSDTVLQVIRPSGTTNGKIPAV